MGAGHRTGTDACHTLTGVARVVVALIQIAGMALVIAAVWQLLSGWVALLLLGLLMLTGALGAEKARMT